MERFRSGKKSLELACYVAGAGAFGVFLRWLQLQLTFDDLGLADKSALHWILALYVIAATVVFAVFIHRFQKQRLSLPDDFAHAFSNSEHKLYRVVRIAVGALLLVGSLLLLYQSGTDKNASDYRVLSLLGALSGIAFPLWLSFADRTDRVSPTVLCILSFVPMLMMAAWLVICYKLNTINSVVWSYLPELITIAVTMMAFFRLGGFVFGKPNWTRCLFDCMVGSSLCILVVADERYLGMQVVFLALAAILLLCSWIMVKNLQQGEAPAVKEDNNGGFEKL